ncbi:MAG: hypothetical protein U9Q37_04790 [Euryarchaeota archaeon]|nr:hypothetical protein [Euryarchaeota archaeon]
MDEIDDRLINCGECNVQAHHRVSLRAFCVRHGVSPGDTIEVFVKIVPSTQAQKEIDES